ncbi:MAG: hypothetical protein Q8K74_05040 [Candidatus Nitrotoga sp.]|nr:hypothetical protein [Candidatus Nitrotoga sp.]MDP1855403.1 hypothetical protein [Candidatus Nitrotoga sp.]
MNKQFYDLNIETLADGTIRLEQRDYCGESMILDLHPAQVAYIADSLSANVPERIQTQPNLATERIATLERRMCWMRDRFEECHAALPSDMYERCGEAFEFGAWLAASIDVSGEFCADFPDEPSNPLARPQETSSLPMGDRCLPNSAGCAGEHLEREADVRNGELFSGT